jgi:hypothetical protein
MGAHLTDPIISESWEGGGRREQEWAGDHGAPAQLGSERLESKADRWESTGEGKEDWEKEALRGRQKRMKMTWKE